MSGTLETVKQAYGLARRGERVKLQELIADEATWQPASEGSWNPCLDGQMVLKTLLWRAGSANKLRPGDAIELGDRVVIQLKGKRLERLGAKGLIPRLFQIVEVRDGKIVRMHDYPRREQAFAAAGLKP
jgi:ketosteroid isomerase-like protein